LKLASYQAYKQTKRQDASPGKKQQRAESIGLKAKGREDKDTSLRCGSRITSPFLEERGRLRQLSWWRGQRKPQKPVE
jgi:hypothetical protein